MHPIHHMPATLSAVFRILTKEMKDRAGESPGIPLMYWYLRMDKDKANKDNTDFIR